MGTSLTGTKPKDTYDSLIKVTDNGPLSGTAKYLSDGLGNDSVLALSTSAVGVGTASPTSGRLQVKGTGSTDATNVIFTDNSSGAATFAIRDNGNAFLAGNVGIGTSAPDSNLHIKNTSGNAKLTIETADAYDAYINLSAASAEWSFGYDRTTDDLIFCQADNLSSGERIRFTSSGITFNGDTAAANALDDYEEGTFTPVFRGATSAGSYTFSLGGGSYTKIGNQVTVWITLIDIAESSAGSGNWQISGLPFTSANTFNLARNATACWIRSSAAARDNILCAIAENSSTISFIYDANGSGAASNFTIASDFLTNMDIGLQVTYYV